MSDFSSTTSLKAAVNTGPFLLRLTAIVLLGPASPLAYPGCALPMRGRGDDAAFRLRRKFVFQATTAGTPEEAAYVSIVTYSTRKALWKHRHLLSNDKESLKKTKFESYLKADLLFGGIVLYTELATLTGMEASDRTVRGRVWYRTQGF